MKPINPDFSADFTYFETRKWEEITSLFQEFSLFQSQPYDEVRYGKDGISHMVLRSRDRIVSAAQIRLVRIPALKYGIAYVFWGPMWKTLEFDKDVEIFRQSIRALRNEFAVKKGLVIRIFPRAFIDEDSALLPILEEEGYAPYQDSDINRTLILPLDSSLEELRTSLKQKWRNCLNKAERNNLVLIEGNDQSLFDQINEIYKEMISRKGIPDTARLDFLKRVQESLPANQKLRIYICLANDELSAGAVFSAVGTTGIYLVGATSGQGMKTNASYLIQWSFVKWLKEKGFRYYDLHGINPETNPGTYRFKRGIAGKIGKECDFLGKFEAYDKKASVLVVRLGESLLRRYHNLLKK